MMEDGQMDLVTDGNIKNYEKFILGLSRLNRAFQLVKFWEFTQPCLYLARALPYIATRRIVEGYLVILNRASALWSQQPSNIIYIRCSAMVYLKCTLFTKSDF